LQLKGAAEQPRPKKKTCPIWKRQDGKHQMVYETCYKSDECADGLFCCASGMCMDSETGSTQGPNCLRAQGHLDTCRLANNGQCNYHFPSPEDPACRIGSDCSDCGKERDEWKCRPGEVECDEGNCDGGCNCDDEDKIDVGCMVKKDMPKGKERCRGRALNKFGRRLSEADCKAKCLDSPTCKVVAFHTKSKMCNEYKNCDRPRKTKAPWNVYERNAHRMSKDEVVKSIGGA